MSDAKGVAVACQIHKHSSTCHKKGTACRFHFDGNGRPLYAITTVDLENGTIELRRAHPMVNNHNPAISSIIRANHDITAIFMSSLKRLQSMYYITAYVAKGEDDMSDVTALRDTFRGLEQSGVIPNFDMVDQTRRLMIRMNYLRQSGQQFSGAQVAAMLLRIGNDGMHYTNIRFSRVLVFQFIRYLKSQSIDNSFVHIPDARHWLHSDSDSSNSEDNVGFEGEESTDDHDEGRSTDPPVPRSSRHMNTVISHEIGTSYIHPLHC